MTNEEIERRAAHLLAKLHEARQEGRLAADERLIVAEFVRDIIRQAHGEAVRVTCDVCTAGNVPTSVGGLWMHPYESVCKAGDIHDLRVALESVTPAVSPQ